MRPAEKRRAVFLDRDGVINCVVMRGVKSYPPPTLEEYRFLPGVPEAVRSIRALGFKVFVVTNQPDVGNRVQRLEVVESMHQFLYRELKVDDIEACYHSQGDECLCRKPKPGMILKIAEKWGIDLAKSFMVGDRWSDITAGKAAGCRTFMVGPGYAEEQAAVPDWRVDSLLDASQILMGLEKSHEIPPETPQGVNQK